MLSRLSLSEGEVQLERRVELAVIDSGLERYRRHDPLSQLLEDLGEGLESDLCFAGIAIVLSIQGVDIHHIDLLPI